MNFINIKRLLIISIILLFSKYSSSLKIYSVGSDRPSETSETENIQNNQEEFSSFSSENFKPLDSSVNVKKLRIINYSQRGFLNPIGNRNSGKPNFEQYDYIPQHLAILNANDDFPVKNVSINDINSALALGEGEDPPPHEQVAKMARFIVKNSNWTSMSTISTIESIQGYPFANIFSISDGPKFNSTGVPYLYLTGLDLSVIDLSKNPKASMTMSLAQTNYCRQQAYDPEDPRCAHVILTGSIFKIIKGSFEEKFAKMSLFSRHEEMSSWPKDHDWFFAKLDIKSVILLDYFGGAKSIKPEEYFNAN